MRLNIAVLLLFIGVDIGASVLCPPLTYKEIEDIRKSCMVKVGIESNPTEHPRYKDFLFCFYEKQGYQRYDGRIIRSSLINYLRQFYSERDIKDVVNSCANDAPNMGDPAETALHLQRCLWYELSDLDNGFALKWSI